MMITEARCGNYRLEKRFLNFMCLVPLKQLNKCLDPE
jgi:hypothetical protein